MIAPLSPFFRVVDITGNGTGIAGFVEDLRETMRAWNWTPATIEDVLPKLIAVFVEVGIVRALPDGSFETTALVGDDAAWERAWKRAEEEGIDEAPAG